PLPVLRRVDPLDAIPFELPYFGGNDHAAATAKHPDVSAAPRAERIDHVLEVLDVPALIRRNRDPLHVFVQRRRHDFVHRPVVAEMDYFRAGSLEYPPYDVDRGVVAVEQARGGDEPQPGTSAGGSARQALNAQIGHRACPCGETDRMVQTWPRIDAVILS